MDKKGTQSINCSVTSCRYCENGNSCGLISIHIAPISSVVDTPEESMCQSFKKRGD